MSDYISREAAVKIDQKYGLMNGSALRRHTGLADRIAIEIEGLPAADVEPVVYGYWEPSEYRGVVRCSVCKDAYIDEDWLSSGKWGGCPNYRAKMDLAPSEGDSHG